jgi:SAM-dependent methyltransferase
VTRKARAPFEPKAWEEVPCPFCASSRRRLYERFGWRKRFTYQRCLACGLIYQSPRPVYDEAFIDTVYGDYVSITDITLAKEGDLREYVGGLMPVAEEMATFDTTRTSLLDVGSCMGLFLRAAMPLWPKVAGVEISARMREIVEKDLGVKIHGERFEALKVEERFSCIQMSHVIEHVPNPGKWLDKARELLRDDGVLVIAVPNIAALGERFMLLMKRIGLRKGEWSDPGKTPDHLFEPPVGVMKRFIEAHGFDVVSHYTYSRSDEISRKPFNRLYRRALLQGSNARFYARPRPRSRVT